MGLIWLRAWTSGTFVNAIIETSGPVKCWGVLEWLHKWRPLQRGSASCRQFIFPFLPCLSFLAATFLPYSLHRSRLPLLFLLLLVISLDSQCPDYPVP
jgi:hypothetical protein